MINDVTLNSKDDEHRRIELERLHLVSISHKSKHNLDALCYFSRLKPNMASQVKIGYKINQI